MYDSDQEHFFYHHQYLEFISKSFFSSTLKRDITFNFCLFMNKKFPLLVMQHFCGHHTNQRYPTKFVCRTLERWRCYFVTNDKTYLANFWNVQFNRNKIKQHCYSDPHGKVTKKTFSSTTTYLLKYLLSWDINILSFCI